MIVSDASTIYGIAWAKVINYAPRVEIYAPRVTLQIVASFNDDSRGVIYNRNKFIVQATD
jgi:hypothetical protein